MLKIVCTFHKYAWNPWVVIMKPKHFTKLTPNTQHYLLSSQEIKTRIVFLKVVVALVDKQAYHRRRFLHFANQLLEEICVKSLVDFTNSFDAERHDLIEVHAPSKMQTSFSIFSFLEDMVISWEGTCETQELATRWVIDHLIDLGKEKRFLEHPLLML